MEACSIYWTSTISQNCKCNEFHLQKEILERGSHKWILNSFDVDIQCFHFVCLYFSSTCKSFCYTVLFIDALLLEIQITIMLTFSSWLLFFELRLGWSWKFSFHTSEWLFLQTCRKLMRKLKKRCRRKQNISLPLQSNHGMQSSMLKLMIALTSI